MQRAQLNKFIHLDRVYQFNGLLLVKEQTISLILPMELPGQALVQRHPFQYQVLVPPGMEQDGLQLVREQTVSLIPPMELHGQVLVQLYLVLKDSQLHGMENCGLRVVKEQTRLLIPMTELTGQVQQIRQVSFQLMQ